MARRFAGIWERNDLSAWPLFVWGIYFFSRWKCWFSCRFSTGKPETPKSIESWTFFRVEGRSFFPAAPIDDMLKMTWKWNDMSNTNNRSDPTYHRFWKFFFLTLWTVHPAEIFVNLRIDRKVQMRSSQPGDSAGDLFGSRFQRLSDLQLGNQKRSLWITWNGMFTFSSLPETNGIFAPERWMVGILSRFLFGSLPIFRGFYCLLVLGRVTLVFFFSFFFQTLETLIQNCFFPVSFQSQSVTNFFLRGIYTFFFLNEFCSGPKKIPGVEFRSFFFFRFLCFRFELHQPHGDAGGRQKIPPTGGSI